MKFDEKQLKEAVEAIRLPEDMGERLLSGGRAARPEAKRGNSSRKAVLASLAACAVLVVGFGLWRAGGERLWNAFWGADHPVVVPTTPAGEASDAAMGGAAPGYAGTEEPSGSGEAPNQFIIDLRSERELEELREMAVCGEEDVLQGYLERKGFQSREELTAFLELLDSLPYLPLLDGRIIWIGYHSGLDFHSRKPYTPTASLFITTQAQNGDWVRLQYTFPAGEAPTPTGDGEITLKSEKREKHPDKAGTLISWDMDVGGLPVRAEYYTKHPENVVTEDVFAHLAVQRLGD